MSYTGTHPHNAICSPAPAASSFISMYTESQNRREVRPLGSDGTVSHKHAHTANLEAQVRVLEQEVRLLRSGLAQNQKLQQSSQPASSPERRVHFGPSSVIPIPRATTAKAISSLKVAQKPSNSTLWQLPQQQRRSSSSASPSFAATTGKSDGCPRLAFGQRVDPSVPRAASNPAASATVNTKPLSVFATSSNGATTTGRAHSTKDSEHPEDVHLSPGAAMLPASKNTAYVQLSPAPASLRGSNTAGIPLQGAATGATVVAAVEGTAPSPAASPSLAAPAATVWASADPSFLQKRAAAAANLTDAAKDTAGGAVVDLVSSYPFRVSTSSTINTFNTTATAAVSATAPPILVTMSSDKLPSSVTGQSSSTGVPPVSLAPPTVPAPTQTPAIVESSTAEPEVASEKASASESAVAPAAASPQSTNTVSVPASTTASMSKPLTSTVAETSVDELKTQISELRDTLNQRESLLHRVLVELHGCNSTNHSLLQHRPSLAEDQEEQSRRTLRLLTQELLAAQTQLSHARVSYQLLQEEVQRRSPHHQEQREQQPQQQQESIPTPSPPTPPVNVELQAQLDTALLKVKAWEDWYASTAPTGAENNNNAAGAGIRQAGTEAPPHKAKENNAEVEKQKKKKRRTIEGEEGANQKGRSSYCPHCGSVLPENSSKGPSVLPAGHFSSAINVAPPTLISAYASDDALYNFFTSNGLNATTQLASSPSMQQQQQHLFTSSTTAPSARVAAAQPASATPPPAQSPVRASAPPQESPNISRKSFRCPAAGAADAFHARWETANDSVGGVRSGRLALQPSTPYYCDNLEHAKIQSYYNQQFSAQMARGAAVRELAEVERQVAEERLALLQRQSLCCTPPSAGCCTPRPDDTNTPAAVNRVERNTTRETVDDK